MDWFQDVGNTDRTLKICPRDLHAKVVPRAFGRSLTPPTYPVPGERALKTYSFVNANQHNKVPENAPSVECRQTCICWRY